MAAFALFAASEASAASLAGDWRLKPAHEGVGLESGYADPSFDDANWDAIRLPHLRHATAEQDTLWYRHNFDRPFGVRGDVADGRTFLRFGGSFYRTRTWLNGVDLGNHEGYFQPFGYDVTGLLKPGDNLLAVRCRFPVEAGSFKRKTAIAGIFTDWDCKPYPSQFYPDLPEPNAWTVPIGLWQPVTLHRGGPAVVESLNVFPKVVEPDWGRGRARRVELTVAARLLNLLDRSLPVRLTFEVLPMLLQKDSAGLAATGRGLDPNAQPAVEELVLAAGEQRDVQFTGALAEPRLWFPWTHGEPYVYRTRLTVASPPAPPIAYEQTFGVRDIRAVIGVGQWEWWLNGRRVFLRGSNYVSDFYLDRVTPDGLRRDLELARGANLDLLRVHAHIAPPEFYNLCDQLGLLVMCDFPLIWTYGFNLPPPEAAEFRASVLTQVGDMVRLLGSHPSIALWSMHNEPPWTPDGSFLGSDVHESATNRQLDEDSAALVQALDSTRPVIPASGVFDQHLYHGWYTGSWTDNRDLQPSFPTEFGVQALPRLESPFWATVNSAWPVDAEDVSWAHCGYQSIIWAVPGVGLPAQYSSLADYVAESQAYQAFYIRRVVDGWRRRKFDPTGGYIHFLFTDGWPAITWSVLDYFRLPKAGYTALADVSRPVHVCLDLTGQFKVERAFHLVFEAGAPLDLGLWLVNDDYRQSGRVEMAYWIERRGPGPWRNLLGALASLAARRFQAELPRADEGARLVQTLHLPLRHPGDYTFMVQLSRGMRVLDTNSLEFRVGDLRRHVQTPRRVPGLLVNRVYVHGSLRHTADGFTFSLRNPAMPVRLERLRNVQVDGQAVDLATVEVLQAGAARHAAGISTQSPLEIPSGSLFTIVVRDHRLAPGLYELDLTAEFMGLGEVAAKFQDKLV